MMLYQQLHDARGFSEILFRAALSIFNALISNSIFEILQSERIFITDFIVLILKKKQPNRSTLLFAQ